MPRSSGDETLGTRPGCAFFRLKPFRANFRAHARHVATGFGPVANVDKKTRRTKHQDRHALATDSQTRAANRRHTAWGHNRRSDSNADINVNTSAGDEHGHNCLTPICEWRQYAHRCARRNSHFHCQDARRQCQRFTEIQSHRKSVKVASWPDDHDSGLARARRLAFIVARMIRLAVR
jgi:hypothetical protein